MIDRARLFDAIRTVKGKALTQGDVDLINAALDGGLTVSKAGLDLIREFEGLELQAYPDPATGNEPWTIGVGTTIYPDGRRVKKGDKISEAQAMEYLAHDVASFADGVAKLVSDVPTTQAQFSAMVSLAYNIGLRAFTNSTLLKKHRAGDYLGAAGEFPKWNKGNGKVMAGLVRRRAAEAQLYKGLMG